jgi:nicotinamide phosphoribosyltransferase
MNNQIINPFENNIQVDFDNIVFTLDGYKAGGHARMMPEGTTLVSSYLESRPGSKFSFTMFYGLQIIIKKWLVQRVTKKMVDQAEAYLKFYFFDEPNLFNRDQWMYIVEKLDGKLPLRICAVEEGTRVPVGEVMMTIENTDPNCYWLTNAMETLLMHVWYGSLVATQSRLITDKLEDAFIQSSDNVGLHKYYNHDFGGRSTSCVEQAGIGGSAHLVNQRGTDTLAGVPFALNYYGADPRTLAASVKASEHSIQASYGREREFEVTREIIKKFPNGILSIVSDTYGIKRAIEMYCTGMKEEILGRNGKFVVRPDSPMNEGEEPWQQITWITKELGKGFGTTMNSKGYTTLHPKIGGLYGDGLSMNQIFDSIDALLERKINVESFVYGQGGGLLQKGLDRDTQRTAIKCNAQIRNGEVIDVSKDPTDKSKKSKAGFVKLIEENGKLKTVSREAEGKDLLRLVFEDGQEFNSTTFDEVRARADRR